MYQRSLTICVIIIGLLIPSYLTNHSLLASANAQSGRQKDKNKKDGNQDIIEDKKGDAIKIDASVVNLDITVTDKKTGGIYQNLQPGNFAIYEDGVKQDITNFVPTEAPITLVMVLEYSRLIGGIRNEVINPAGQFVTQFVQPKDQVAIVAYDIKPAVLNDFTDNKGKLSESVSILIRNTPSFSESNLFDALNFVIKGGKLDKVDYGGIDELPGRSAILLISSGFDTFSKLTFDKALKVVEQAGIPIYTIGIGNFFFKLNEPRLSDEQRLGFYQAANQLKTFSETSGGRYFPVTFQGEIPTDLKAITALLRNQYSVGYTPTNPRRQGKRRKIEVHVDVNGDGKADDKDLIVQHRKVYTEPKE